MLILFGSGRETKESARVDQNDPAAPSGFTAFISYSQRDLRVARRLHLALKAYRVPKGVNAAGLRRDRSLGPIFRDEENMAADPSLRRALNTLIDSSRHLIVVCTPHSARSKWVDDEVRRFKRRKQPKVLAVIAKGEPHSSSPETECFCPALTVSYDEQGNPTSEPDEPSAANLRRESRAKVVARLAAGLLDIPFDDLWRHDRRRTRRRRIAIGSVAATATLLLLISAAEAVRSSDTVSLLAHSVQISQEAWRRGSDDTAFHPAFRAALAATPLSGSLVGRGGTAADCSLNGTIAAAPCALALSGTVLPRAVLFDERPDTPRANFRDDIPDARGIERRARDLLESVRFLAFSGNSNRVALAHSDGRLLVYDRKQNRTVLSTDKIPGGVGPVALNRDGTQVLLANGRDMSLKLCEVDSGRNWLIPFQFEQVHEVKSAGSAWLLVASRTPRPGSRETKLVRLNDGKVTKEIPIQEYTPYFSNGFNASSSRFISFTGSNGAQLFDVDVGASTVTEIEISNLGEGVGQVKALATDPRAHWVVLGGNGSGGSDNAAQVISVRRREVTGRLAGHTGEISAIAFTPDAELVATGSSDMTVRLWRRGTATEVYRLSGHESGITGIAMSSDGTSMATTASDATVYLWDLAAVQRLHAGDVRDEICHRKLPHPFTRPSTLVSPKERQETSMYQGRPWDLCEWRGIGTPVGFVQSLRALLVRAGMKFLDYQGPNVLKGLRSADFLAD